MVTAYPVANKKKATEICEAFARGCGGKLATTLQPGPAFFYGVDHSNRGIWEAVLADGRDYFYADNSFFDSRRQASFRVAKNRLQHAGTGISSGARFAALGIPVAPWRAAGNHFVVCPQSDHFMRVLAGYDGDWGRDIVAYLRANSRRPIRCRDWNPNKGALAATLHHDLVGAHALITWSSAAAVTAILAGVPAIVHSNDCVARTLAGDPWLLEDLATPDRLNWAGVLADHEWSLAEFRDGTAWKALNGE